MTTVGMNARRRLDVRLDGTRRFIHMNVAATCNTTRIGLMFPGGFISTHTHVHARRISLVILKIIQHFTTGLSAHV